MKVDCYNACECSFSDMDFGDPFYSGGFLYIRVLDWRDPNKYVGVKLSTGYLEEFSADDIVVKAEAKVVAVSPIE